MAGSKSKTPQTQMHIAAALNKTTRKAMSLDEVVAHVRKEHPDAIEAEANALIDMAMRAIARRHTNFRPGSASDGQLELFAEYAVSEKVIIPLADKNGVLRATPIPVEKLTLDQAREYVEAHKRTPKKSKRLAAMERLIKDVSPYGTGDSTLSECWKAKVAKDKKA